MKFLFLGDIVGKAGRKAVREVLPNLRQELAVDFVIANGENLAHGSGATRKTIEEVQEAGVDFFTSGNHIWQTKEAEEILQDKTLPIIRPANYPEGTPGDGYRIIEVGASKRILIANVLGQVFFNENCDSPFRTLDKILEETASEKLDAIIVDAHMEITSEIQAFGFYLDGRVSAVIGTHTHVPTADARVLPKGTAFVTDAGMVGVRDTSLGVDTDVIIKQMLTQRPQKFARPEEGLCRVDGVVFEIEKRKASKIERVYREVEV
ncbi:TIGR00282 family metallophosphoesterase [Patescibacteria group bacterium]